MTRVVHPAGSVAPAADSVRPGAGRFLLIGAAAGFLAGLFGVGGGILMVPALTLVLRIEQRLAHGASLTATIPIALAGALGFWLEGQVDAVVVLAVAPGAIVGAIVGAGALRRISVAALRYAFAGALVLVAVRMFLDSGNGLGRGDVTVAGVVALIALGLVSGTVAGILGVGGGILLVPAFVLLLGLPAVVAKGTSLAIIVPTAISGTVRHARHGNTDLRAAMQLGVAGVISSFAASQLSLQLDPRLSSALFALLLVVAAVRMVLQTRNPSPA